MLVLENSKPWYNYVTYDQNSPSCLVWTQTVGKGGSLKYCGDVAGGISSFGKLAKYWRIGLKGKTYFNHRVIWEMFNGELQKDLVINHIDNNPLNNTVSNLELVSMKENTHKTYQHNGLGLCDKNNTGILGVSNYVRNINNKMYCYAHAQFRNKDGLKIQKYFRYTLNDLQSEVEAFDKAKLWRKENILQLVEQGLAYYNKEHL